VSTYRVEYAPAAHKQIRKLDPVAQDRVIRTIALLASNPRPPKATQLVGGRGEWRVRTGDYRIVYEVHDDVWWSWSCASVTAARSIATSERAAPA